MTTEKAIPGTAHAHIGLQQEHDKVAQCLQGREGFTFGNQVIMCAPLNHLAVIYDNDFISVLNSGQAMRNHQHCAALCCFVQCVLDCCFTFSV